MKDVEGISRYPSYHRLIQSREGFRRKLS